MELKVTGMTCGHCEKTIKNALQKLKIKNVKVDLETGIVSFKENKKVSRETIARAIIEAGYQVE